MNANNKISNSHNAISNNDNRYVCVCDFGCVQIDIRNFSGCESVGLADAIHYADVEC